MEVRQLNLWDNVAAETGFQQLIELKFREAAKCFSEAQDSPVQIDPAVMAGKRACSFWEQRIGPWQEALDPKELTINDIQELLTTYQGYSFKWLNTFSVQLLEFIHSLMQQFLVGQPADNAAKNCPVDLYSTARLLIEVMNKEPELSSRIPVNLRTLIELYPNDGRLYYLSAAAYYNLSEKAAANLMYSESLLKFPEDIPEDFSFPPEIDSLIQLHGPGKAVIYGAIDGFLPCPPIDEHLQFEVPEQQSALDCYRLFRQAEMAFKNSDMKTSIKCRKEIMLLDKDLCERYLTIIRKRESRTNTH